MWIRSADQLLLELRRDERFTNEVGEARWDLERLGLIPNHLVSTLALKCVSNK